MSVLLTGCSLFSSTPLPQCKVRAYTRTPLEEYLSSRAREARPARLAIIPFTVPANLASVIHSTTGLGHELAWAVHQELVMKESAPIIELLNRDDWPGKRDEFFAGNYGAISQAYEAGFNLVLVGTLKELHSLERATLLLKIIDVEKAITLTYISAEVETFRDRANQRTPSFLAPLRDPSRMTTENLFVTLSECAAGGLFDDTELPEDTSWLDWAAP